MFLTLAIWTRESLSHTEPIYLPLSAPSRVSTIWGCEINFQNMGRKITGMVWLYTTINSGGCLQVRCNYSINTIGFLRFSVATTATYFVEPKQERK